jgi:hypothetical protein
MLPPTMEEKGQQLVGCLVLLVIAIVVFAVADRFFEPSHPPSAETVARRDLCDVSRVCRKYRSSLEDCAAAADLERCIRIKMGADIPFDYCTDDGGVQSYAKSALLKNAAIPSWPSRWTCLVSELMKR